MGENGAGKSTLIKAITGALPLDAGRAPARRRAGALRHRRTTPSAPASARSTRRSTCCRTSRVAENIALGREPRRFGVDRLDAACGEHAAGRARRPRARHRPGLAARHALARRSSSWSRSRGPSRRTSRCSSSTSRRRASTSTRCAELFRVIRDLKQRGVAILFVSHFLDQVYEICDRVTVLRDGKLVGEYLTTRAAAHRPGAGDARAQRRRARAPGRACTSPRRSAPPYLSARGVTVGSGHRGRRRRPRSRARCSVSPGCSARGGPSSRAHSPASTGWTPGIIHIAGHGRRTCAGPRTGDVPRASSTPPRTAAPRASSASSASARTSPSRCRPSAAFLRRIRPARQRELAASWVDALDIRPADVDRPAGTLSGGNQQKVLLARLLALSPRALRAGRADPRHRRRREGRDPEPRGRARRQRLVGDVHLGGARGGAPGRRTGSRSCSAAGSSTPFRRTSSTSTR